MISREECEELNAAHSDVVNARYDLQVAERRLARARARYHELERAAELDELHAPLPGR